MDMHMSKEEYLDYLEQGYINLNRDSHYNDNPLSRPSESCYPLVTKGKTFKGTHGWVGTPLDHSDADIVFNTFHIAPNVIAVAISDKSIPQWFSPIKDNCVTTLVISQDNLLIGMKYRYYFARIVEDNVYTTPKSSYFRQFDPTNTLEFGNIVIHKKLLAQIVPKELVVLEPYFNDILIIDEDNYWAFDKYTPNFYEIFRSGQLPNVSQTIHDYYLQNVVYCGSKEVQLSIRIKSDLMHRKVYFGGLTFKVNITDFQKILSKHKFNSNELYGSKCIRVLQELVIRNTKEEPKK